MPSLTPAPTPANVASGGRYNSLYSYAFAVAPAGGATITSLTPGTAGLYRLLITVNIMDGTPGNPEGDNFELFVGGVSKGRLPISVGRGTQTYEWWVYLDGATTVAVKTVGAATGAVTYSTRIQAIPQPLLS